MSQQDGVALTVTADQGLLSVPARSEAQRRYLYMKFGKAWVDRHGFNNKGKLPQHVGPKGTALLRRMKGGST